MFPVPILIDKLAHSERLILDYFLPSLPRSSYLVQLVVDVPDAGEARLSVVHLDEDAPDAPDVERGVVVGGAEEDVGRPVPQRHHLVRVRVGRDGFRAGKT